jgi:hypothetical protein
LEEVKAVFNQASHMVMYPVAPLLDEATEVRGLPVVSSSR